MADIFFKPMYFGTYENTLDYGRRAFYQILYHEIYSRKGNIIQTVFDNGECKLVRSSGNLNQISNIDEFLHIANRAYGKTAECYTTVNVFNKPKRTSENMRYRTAFFVDIDIHSLSDDYDIMLDVRKKETAEVIEAAFASGDLPVPTMIVDTGRGFALYYVLRNSIANTPRTTKIKSFFELIYTQLVKKTDKILSDAKNPMVGSVDTKVYDAARLCRIPGTYNAKAEEICKVSYINFDANKNPVYFELGDIASYVLAPKRNGSIKVEENTHKSRSVTKDTGLGFCYARIQALEKLQELRGHACVDNCREQMLFILYNTLLPVYGIQESITRIADFNNKFTSPLSEKELKHVPNSAQKAAGQDGHLGFYKLTNQYIIESLAMTEEEIKIVGIGVRKKDKERKSRREEKQAIFAQIEDLLKNTSSDTMTYAQIAELTHVSEITVKRFAKKLGIIRHAYPKATNHMSQESIISAPRSNVSPSGVSMAQPCKMKEQKENKENTNKILLDNKKYEQSFMRSCDSKYDNQNTSLIDQSTFIMDKSIDVVTFLNAWEYRLTGMGWAGQALYAQINNIVDIADMRNWDIRDLVEHLNSNLHLYENWEDTYIITEEQKWLKKYLREKRKASWNGPEHKHKKKENTEDMLRPNKTFELDHRFCGITVKNYPWLDSKWLRIVMQIFKCEWKTSSYNINGMEVPTTYVDKCFAAMRQKDIIELLERLCKYIGKIEHPYAFIVSVVYKMKQHVLDKDTATEDNHRYETFVEPEWCDYDDDYTDDNDLLEEEEDMEYYLNIFRSSAELA